MRQAITLTTLLIIMLFVSVYAQEQGYFTNGKERLRAEAEWRPSSDQIQQPTQSESQMIGAGEANQPGPVRSVPPGFYDRQRTSLENQLEEELRLLTMQENKRIADLQYLRDSIRKITGDGIARDCIAMVETMIQRETQLSNQRKNWFDRYKAQRESLSQQMPQQTRTVRDLRGLEESNLPDTEIRQQRRRQSNIEQIESK
jgi:hypothetical protein